MAKILSTQEVPGLRCPMCRSTKYTLLVSRDQSQKRRLLTGKPVKELYHFCCNGTCRIVHPIADSAISPIFALANRIRAERTATTERRAA